VHGHVYAVHGECDDGGAAVTGIRSWVATHQPPWMTARRMKLGTAAILAAGVVASGTHLAPNGSVAAVAKAADGPQSTASSTRATAGGTPSLLDQAILTAVTAAKASGALEAIEGSLVYLGAKYESQKAAQEVAAKPPPEPKKSPPQEASVGGGSSLPPASAGTNGTKISPPPGVAGKHLVARAPSPSSPEAAESTATYISGIALAPPDAPERITGAINAANTIVGKPYIWGGGHGSWYSRGYDCSGAVSFALAGGGFLSSPLTSGSLESWGAPGPGRWLTVYASATHAYAVIAGLRWDTVGDASGTGPRWHLAGAVPAGFVARHPPGY
jgi:cell wall-associated NlpC family hydrolase